MRDYYIFFIKQKTAYEMRISDWSSDVCSSDLVVRVRTHNTNIRTNTKINTNQTTTITTESYINPTTNHMPQQHRNQIGRASCRERVCKYVSISVVAVSLKKKQQQKTMCNTYIICRINHIS